MFLKNAIGSAFDKITGADNKEPPKEQQQKVKEGSNQPTMVPNTTNNQQKIDLNNEKNKTTVKQLTILTDVQDENNLLLRATSNYQNSFFQDSAIQSTPKITKPQVLVENETEDILKSSNQAQIKANNDGNNLKKSQEIQQQNYKNQVQSTNDQQQTEVQKISDTKLDTFITLQNKNQQNEHPQSQTPKQFPDQRLSNSFQKIDFDLQEDDDSVNDLNFGITRNRGQGQQSAALQRIMKKRGTALPIKDRPILETVQEQNIKPTTNIVQQVNTSELMGISKKINEVDQSSLNLQPENRKITQEKNISQLASQVQISQSMPSQVIDKTLENPDFIETLSKRAEISRQAQERREAARKNIFVPSRVQLQKLEELERNSSESYLTDKEFEDNISIDSDEVIQLIQKSESNRNNQQTDKPQSIDKEQSNDALGKIIDDLQLQYKHQQFNKQKTEEQNDFFDLIKYNETMFKQHAEKKLKDQRNISIQTAKSLKQFKDNLMFQSVISEPVLLRQIKFGTLSNYVETCIASNDEVILVGTTAGVLFVFSKETEQQIGVHKEAGKEFIDNAITSIDIHQLRSDYCVLGFQNGQIALININDINKTIKLIKDQYKQPVVSVKFCDWSKEKPHLIQGITHKCKDCTNIAVWMILSCDTNGKVILNTVQNKGFGIMFASEIILFDPQKLNYDEFNDGNKFQVLAPRMSSRDRPQQFENDNTTLIAIGSSENVLILVVNEKGYSDRLMIEKPKRYASQNQDTVMPIVCEYPLLTWGFGKTPRYNYQTQPILAIGWGPLIQLVVFKDINGDPQMFQDFELDGHYIIAPENSKDSISDPILHSLHFLDESLLIGLTQNHEIRVMLTSKFNVRSFEPPQYLEIVKFQDIDSRCKLTQNGSELTPEQHEIEMERKVVLNHSFIKSKYGSEASQSQSVYEDKIVSLTSGGIYRMHHLSWLESLGNFDSTSLKNSWIETFAKALEIYNDKLKGLRMPIGEDDELQKAQMRIQLKEMIDKQVTQIILQWKIRAEQNTQQKTQMQQHDDLNSKFQTLIRIVIEFCVEIQQPVFLFDTMLKKFYQEGKTMLFADELKPYILSGYFSECDISEQILSEQILPHYQKAYQEAFESIQSCNSGDVVSSTLISSENFEKILLNFNFNRCSDNYKAKIIEFCREYSLTSALIYMCLNSYENQGPVQALTQLKDFYLDKCTKDLVDNEFMPQRSELEQLYSMPVNLFDRVQLERSSCYLGLKLFWIARQFLLGYKFPRGQFKEEQWHILCHDIIELITQDDLIQLMTEIDSEAYFQIVGIVFIKPGKQFEFIESGRPNVNEKNQLETISMTHELIVKRISNYFIQQGQILEENLQLNYLCFIATVASNFEKNLTYDEEKLYYNVALELIKKKDVFLHFNKDQIQRRAIDHLYFRKLSRFGNHAPDELKYIQFSESMLLELIQKCKQVLSDKKLLTQLLVASESTDFHNVKLMLYELNDDYLKCLKLFMNRQINQSTEQIAWLGQKDGFSWIIDKHMKLEQFALETKAELPLKQLQNFENEILSQVLFLAKQNIMETIKLCDQIFKSAHYDFLEKLQNEQKIQLLYIQKLLQIKIEDIKDALTSNGFSSQSLNQVKQQSQNSANQKRGNTMSLFKSGGNQQWYSILTLHIKLLCVLEPDQVTQEVEKIIKDNFYPMEDCLKICVEYKQIEASALLNKKIGNYQTAITLYLQILKQGLNFERFKKEIFYLDKENKRHLEKERQANFLETQARLRKQMTNQTLNDFKSMTAINKSINIINLIDKKADLYRVWVEKFGKNIGLVDRILDKMQNLIKSHSKEVLEANEECWQTILTQLFSIMFHQTLRKKSYCKRHLKVKMVVFCRCILPHVPFNKIIYFACTLTKTLRFKAVKELVTDIFCDKSQEFEMCINANTTQARDLLCFQHEVNFGNTNGITFTIESLTCQSCEKIINVMGTFKPLIELKLHEDIKIFDCESHGTSRFNHSYHVRCLKKVINEELERDKNNRKPNQKDLLQNLRCPVCFPKSYDILIEINEIKKSNSNIADSEFSDQDNNQTSKSLKDQQSGLNSYVTQSTINKKPISQIAKKNERREKQMKKFQDLVEQEEVLQIYDFRMI